MNNDKDRAFFEQYVKHAVFNEADKFDGDKKPCKRRKKRIDLHGLNRFDAWERVLCLLGNARAEGLTTITIICGAGHNSSGLPVLPGHIINQLKKHAHLYSSMHVDTSNNITLTLEYR